MTLPLPRKALSLRKPIPRSEGSRDYHRCAHKKVSFRETKVRRDLHVGSGISRHLHRLFASSLMINNPAFAVTFSSPYICTCTQHLFNSHNCDLNLHAQIYLREDRATGACADLSLLSEINYSDSIAYTERILPPLLCKTVSLDVFLYIKLLIALKVCAHMFAIYDIMGC